MVDRTIKSQTVSLNPNQILTKELSPDMKQWEELIRENVFGLGGHQDHLPACLAHMLYCVVAEEQYNLAYFFVKRIQCARYTPTANLPYGMFLTRLYRHVMETYPHIDNVIYDIVDRVMCPLVLKQTRRPRSYRSKARHPMSTPVFVDPEISTQADGAQSSRVPVPLPEDPYEAIRSSYESSPSLSPPDLPLWKRYQGTSELVEDDDKEGDDEEEDEEMEESSDSDSMSEDAEDEGPTEEDEDPATGDEGLVVGDEAPDMEVESLSLGKDEAIPEGQHRAAPVVETAVGGPLGLGYGALRRREIALGEGQMPSVFEEAHTYYLDRLEGWYSFIDVSAYPPPAPPTQTPPSPVWSSGSLLISLAPSVVPSPISSPMISLTVPSHVASPATAETRGFLTIT
ncbi:hypothetical protein Tco_1143959 [Tanacetum coccineum]